MNNTTTKPLNQNNMKQTAVEWLISQLRKPYGDEFIDKIIEQAKAMEKEQLIDAFGVGCQVESTRLIGYHGKAEQYYNETYKLK